LAAELGLDAIHNPTFVVCAFDRILRYWQRVADKYNVRRFMKFRHQCTEARWDEETAKWHVTLLDLASGQVVQDVGDVLMTGVGALNRWEWPEIPGCMISGGN
jgi:cation diffusion facilitator CzcD-associated flavoprotein CzcO